MRIEASPVSGSTGTPGVSLLASSTGPSVVSSLPLQPPVAAHRAPTIIVFDSGLGGLSVFRELARTRPDARFVYAADDAGFPYGPRSEADLVGRVVAVMDALTARLAPDAVVIACNTASTLVLPALRARYASQCGQPEQARIDAQAAMEMAKTMQHIPLQNEFAQSLGSLGSGVVFVE